MKKNYFILFMLIASTLPLGAMDKKADLQKIAAESNNNSFKQYKPEQIAAEKRQYKVYLNNLINYLDTSFRTIDFEIEELSKPYSKINISKIDLINNLSKNYLPDLINKKKILQDYHRYFFYDNAERASIERYLLAIDQKIKALQDKNY